MLIIRQVPNCIKVMKIQEIPKKWVQKYVSSTVSEQWVTVASTTKGFLVIV